MNKQLIFVYNAKSGFMHGVMDLMHKTAGPKTYPCKLCQITYSGATMNKLWKQYLSGLMIHAIFMHRDEFTKAYPTQKIMFPAVLLKIGPSFKLLLSADDFKKLNNLNDLINSLNEKITNASF